MRRYVVMLLCLLFAAGCSQTIRTSKVGDAFEVEVHDDGTTAFINSSQLHRDWEDAAGEICPNGYTIINQQYFKEEPFKPARIVGTISCK